MNLSKDRFPWKLEIVAMNLILRHKEAEFILERAMALVSPRYIECIKLYQMHPKNKVLKHNYHLLATIYDLLVLEQKNQDKRQKAYGYYEITSNAA